MVSKLSNIARNWNSNQETHGKYVSKQLAPAKAFPVSSRDDLSSSYSEYQNLECPRIQRRESGSAVFHWGDDDLDSVLASFSERDQDDRSAIQVGFKPSFSTSDGGKLLVRNCRKTVNNHIRLLSGKLQTQKVVLNRKGSCYFYFDRFLLTLEVPQHTGMMTISTVVHRRIHSSSDDEASQESSEYSINSIPEDEEINKSLPSEMSLRVKRGNQILLSYPTKITTSFEGFVQGMEYFVNVADALKAQLKPTMGWVEL